MPRTNEIRYEVQVRTGKRWSIYTDSPTKLRAISEARTLLGSGKFDGVKVTEDRGQVREIVVFEEEGTARAEDPITITAIDEAELCNSPDEVSAFEGRRTIGRVLRKYLDHHEITPVELVHNHELIRGLQREHTLYTQAMQAVAGVQARKTDDTTIARIDFLERAAREILDRARDFRDLKASRLKIGAKGLAGILAAIDKEIAEGNRAFYYRAGLAKFLATVAGWNDKLDLLVGEVEKEPTDDVFALVDEGIAEIFDSPEAIRVLFGYQKNTAAGIKTLVHIASGAYAQNDDGAGDPVLVRLSTVMAACDLENTLVVILNRVAKTLAGVQPLTKGSREEERAAFEDLIGEVMTQIATAHSGDVSEAVSSRARMVYGDGFTDLEPGLAIEMVLRQLPNDAARFGYLLDLCGTPFGLRNQSHVIRALAGIVNGLTTVASLVGPDVDERGVIRAAAEIRDRLLSTKLPDEWRLRFARTIYDLLLDYNRGGAGAGPKKKGKKGGAAAGDAPIRVVKIPDLGDDATFATREIPAGEFLFREGDDGDEAYLIHDGRVAILRKAGKTDVVIAEVGAGSIVGEMALIDAEPRMASARAETATKVTVIPMDEMKKRLDRLEESDPVMRHLVEMFVQRMRDYRIVASGP